MGTLYYGDNLDILRRHLKDETVDLVYLDPPFNSAQNYNAFFHDYNAFFHEKDGTDAASQIRAFEDTYGDKIEIITIGEPVTPNEAATLAEQDKYQFQWWALGLVGARPVEQKKGADHGIEDLF